MYRVPNQGKFTPEEWAEIKACTKKYRAGRQPKAKEVPPEPIRLATAFGYRRCSHKDSAETRHGLNTQKEMIDAYFALINAKRKASGEPELLWGGLFSDEVVSASKRRLIARSQGKRLNLSLQDGDHVIIARLDRGFRNLRDLLETYAAWEKRGITIHFALENIDPTTSTGRLMMNLMGALAQWQAECLGDRIREVARQFRAQGKTGIGQAPFGFKLVGAPGKRKVVSNPDERKVMCEIVRIRDTHNWSWARISDHIEGMLAQKEQREPIPHSAFHPRTWYPVRCKRAYKAELRLREKLKQSSDPAVFLAR